MSEKFPYNLEKAQEEAAKVQAKVESGEVKDYAMAEKLAEKEAVMEWLESLPLYWFSETSIEKKVRKMKEEGLLSEEDLHKFLKDDIASKRTGNHLKPIEYRKILDSFFSVPEEFLYSTEVQEMIKGRILEEIEKTKKFPDHLFSYTEEIVKILEHLPLSEKNCVDLWLDAIDVLSEHLRRGLDYYRSDTNFERSLKLKELLKIPEDNMRVAAEKAIRHGKTSSRGMLRLQEKFSVPMETLNVIAKDKVIAYLKAHNFWSAWDVLRDIPLSSEILRSSEVQNVAKEIFIDINRKCKPFFSSFHSGDLTFNQVKNVASLLSKENFVSPEIQQSIENKLLKILSYNPQYKEYIKEEISVGLKYSTVFPLQQERITRAAEQALIFHLSEGNWEAVREIEDKFSLSTKTINIPKQILSKILIGYLSNNNYDSALGFQKRFLIPENFISPEIQSAAKGVFVHLLSKGWTDKALEIKENFLPDLDTAEFVKSQYTSYLNDGKWDLVIKLKSHFPECEPMYQEFLAGQRGLAENIDLPFSERQKAFDILAGLAENGETSISKEFSEIISARTKQEEAPDSKWGLDPLQEEAFYTLMRLDNAESNSVLFDMVFDENINSTIKYAVLKKLLRDDSNFLNSQLKENLHGWLYSTSPKQADWRDLQFVEEIQKIPSKELRDKSLTSLSAFGEIDLVTFPLYKTWSEKYSNIPQNVYLQISNLEWACDSAGLMDKFQKLFTSIRKEGSKKDNLLYGITNVLETDHQVLRLLGEKLEGIDFGSKEDADSLSELLRRIVFLNRIENIKNYQHNDDQYDDYDRYEDYEEQPQEKSLPPEIVGIFSKETKSLGGLVALVKEVATQKFQEVLPNKNITAEKIEVIEKEWGDLEPVFTYLGRYPGLKEYVAEIVANIDTTDGWKSWRYDMKNKGVKAQIGHMSEEQRVVWENDYFSEMGDIMIAESSSDKPLQIQNILRDAVLTHKHIFNPEQGQNKNEYIQKAVEGVYSKVNESPDKKDAIVGEAVTGLSAEAKSVDAIVDFNNLPRIRQCMESIVPEKAEIEINKKVKDAVDFLSPYLSKELGEILSVNYEKIGDKKKINSEELITPEIRAELNKEIKEIEENYNKALESDVWEKLGLDKNNLKNLGQFYQKRQELKAAIDLLRLNNLSNKLIATNKIVEKEGKKGGETITSVVDNLKKFFKDSPLLLDLKNVEFALKEKIDFGEKRRLAMILSDNPQMLWQAGKYPTGNGSCQHYAEGSHANRLMGYVGDANCKVSYLIDLNKLPADIKKELDEKGFEEIKNKIPTKDLLSASLARSMVKMVKDRDNKPVVLIEPTYTVVYKGDVSMDKYYNVFIDLMLADPMKAKIARGGGSDEVIKGRSRSPEGQYEDLDLNNVKFVHRSSKPTKGEMEVMERIRSSR